VSCKREIEGVLFMFTKYLERGLSVIPIRDAPGAKGKAPFINGWQKWCEQLPTQQEAEIWDSKYKRYGLCCGPISAILAMDIDTDDKTVLDAVKPSPVVKRGRKGETRFYKYNPEIQSCKIAGIIDVLSNGKQTVLPPTIHSETGEPYVWLTTDTLENFDVKDLPEYSIKEFNSLISKLNKTLSKDIEVASTEGVDLTGGPWFNDDPTRKCPHGSHDRLKRIVTAMIARGASPDECTTELLRYDTENHKPTPYFQDDTRPDYKGDPVVSAILFYSGNLATFNRRNSAHILTPQVAGSEIIIIEDNLEPTKSIEQFKHREYPEPTGLIKDIKDFTIDLSDRYTPNIALGGALATVAALACNRYRFKRCWPNLYILNLAPTGSGKGYPHKALTTIIERRVQAGLTGFGSYQSAGAFIKNLKSKRVRLDQVDECAQLFSQMKAGGLWQTAITDEMCKVWSSSCDLYIAPEYAGKDDASTCFNPCVNVLFSSTVVGISPHINNAMFAKGLMPRFLIFKDEKYGPPSKEEENEELLRIITEKIKRILEVPMRESQHDDKDILRGPIYDPINIEPTDKIAKSLFNDIKADFFKRVETEASEPIKNMITRGKEMIMKISTNHAVGNFRTVTTKDLEWGREVFEVSLHNSTEFIDEVSADTEWERDVAQFMNLFKKKTFITMPTITDRIKRLQPQRIETLVKHLIGAEKITRSVKEVKGKKIQGWSLLSG